MAFKEEEKNFLNEEKIHNVQRYMGIKREKDND